MSPRTPSLTLPRITGGGGRESEFLGDVLFPRRLLPGMDQFHKLVDRFHCPARKPLDLRARSIAPNKPTPWAMPHACICLTELAPIPRGGTFTIRSSDTSSCGFTISRRYASVSLISLRL